MDQIDINNIKPYDKNAKKHPEKQLKKLAEIVKEVGWRQLTGTKPKELKHRPKFKYALTVSKLEQAFSIGCTVSEACLYAEIGRNSYYRWTKNNKILKDRFEALKEKPILQARQTIVSNLKDNVDVARWYLEKKKKDEFGAKLEIDQNIKGDRIFKVEIITSNDKHKMDTNGKTESGVGNPE